MQNPVANPPLKSTSAPSPASGIRKNITEKSPLPLFYTGPLFPRVNIRYKKDPISEEAEKKKKQQQQHRGSSAPAPSEEAGRARGSKRDDRGGYLCWVMAHRTAAAGAALLFRRALTEVPTRRVMNVGCARGRKKAARARHENTPRAGLFSRRRMYCPGDVSSTLGRGSP